ncbi:MAG: hypothetical protein Kow001_13530 [Acidobacteriota bacterium]
MSTLRKTGLWAALLMSPALQAATDLTPKFQALRQDVVTSTAPDNMKTALLALLKAAEDRSADGVSSPFAVIEQMNAFAIQTTDFILLPEPLDPGPLVAKSDEISAILFFESGDLLSNLPPPPDPVAGCTIRILRRVLGRTLDDPGGAVVVHPGELVQFTAQPSIPGGEFQWVVQPQDIDSFVFSQGDRLSIRALDDTTLRILVRYNREGQFFCLDSTFLQPQGDLSALEVRFSEGASRARKQ